MRFYCNSKELENAINIVSKALDSKKGIPILEGIKIEASGSVLTLYATDLELFIQTSINAEILIEGEIVVPGRFISDFIKKLTAFERIEFEEIENNQLVIKSGESINQIKLIEDEFPVTESIDNDRTIEIKQSYLKELIEKSVFCVAVDGTRPVIKGCLIEVRDKQAIAVALDGFRLAKITKPLEKAVVEHSFIVPGKKLEDIGRIIEDNDNIVKISTNDKLVTFDMGATKITSQLIEGKFIDYNRIIPEHFETVVDVKIDEFMDSLDRISIISRTKKDKNQARFNIMENKVVIYSSSEIAQGKEIVPAKVEGKEIEIAFNISYISAAMSRIRGDYARIAINTNNTPARITEIGSDESLYIVLPIRLI